MYSALNKKCEIKPVVSLKTFEVNSKLKPIDISRKKTKFGDQILVELQDCVVFLGQRFATEIDDKTLELIREDIEKGILSIIITGRIGEITNLEFHKEESL